MRKEKKIKSQKQEKKTMYVIGAVIAVFLVTILFLNTRQVFKKIEARDCVKSMILMQEGMLQLQKELPLQIPSDILFDDLANILAYYYHFGPVVLTNPTTGTLQLKPVEELKNLPLVERKDRYILDIPKCPSKGKYALIPSKEKPGLFDILCSVHGTVFFSEKENRYLFTGDLDALNPRDTALGKESDVYFGPEESTKDFVTIVPYVQDAAKPKQGQNRETAD
ncbi:hypothetical protein JW926_13400 [Candidatus Sumerlaeota bacterium]|nr:hypothetical protein [Candidatus Sumerlaeota bacterium]